MNFEELILHILQCNSGGTKITDLIVEVVVYLKEHAIKGFSDLQVWTEGRSPFIDAVDKKLAEMEAAGKIGLLKYGWDMGDGVCEKIFIYTPIEQTTVFCCPPSTTCKCNCGTEEPRICEHKWDGEEETMDCGSSVTCSKCGMSAMSHDMRCCP